ncbi:MAG: sugar ABC transporter permease [Clostridiales bacterium]|jgi:arabinogalactan oligomer/maltooligosaccharide transport system permease protein|nr:sugar ABC transporter permease [Clostridiales bacterium]
MSGAGTIAAPGGIETLPDKQRVFILSLVFMGLAHLTLLKQYVKGALFALCELVFICFLPAIVGKISDLITLGTPTPELLITQRDNSVFMLIDGIMILAVIAVFAALYYISARSAKNECRAIYANGKFPPKRSAVQTLTGSAFPVAALTPAFILIVFFVIVPLIFSACVAFTNYSSPDHIPPSNTVDWVGLDNFVFMFGGDNIWSGALFRVTIWTVIWAALATFTCYFGGMAMAVVMRDSKLKVTGLFRAIFILPYAVPAAISLMVWRNLLNGSFGTINQTLMQLGLIKDAIPWLSDPLLAQVMVIIINLWAGFPYFMLLVTGAMTAVPNDCYEAASIDGASKWQVFRHVTLPQVLYQTAPLIIMSFTHNINNFGAIWFLTAGYPAVSDSTLTSARGTDILVSWIYNLTVISLKYNYAAVLAVMIFVALAPFAIMNFRRTKSFKEGAI